MDDTDFGSIAGRPANGADASLKRPGKIQEFQNRYRTSRSIGEGRFVKKAGQGSSDELRAEYRLSDFTSLVRGKYYRRYMESSNVVVLEPDVHRRFRNSSAVNKALRSLMRAEGARRGQTKRPARTRRDRRT
jgi:hypothetical protein